MTLEEAEQKAQDAVEMRLIDKSQEEAYTQHLLENRKLINKDVDHDTSISIDSNTYEE